MNELEELLKKAGEKPYFGKDYSIKRRRLTKAIKNIIRKKFGNDTEIIIKVLESSRGFTPSDQLLKYSSKAFERALDAIIATCTSVTQMDDFKKNELKREILEAVIDVKSR